MTPACWAAAGWRVAHGRRRSADGFPGSCLIATGWSTGNGSGRLTQPWKMDENGP